MEVINTDRYWVEKTAEVKQKGEYKKQLILTEI
jgi:hypothetical protein